MNQKRGFMTRLECRGMSRGKQEVILLVDLEAHKASVDLEALKDSMINSDKVVVEEEEHLLGTYLKSLTNFLEETSNEEDREEVKVDK